MSQIIYQTPKIKETDLKITETINRQFLNNFYNDGESNPKPAIETCDLHLDGLQPLKFTDPKKNWVDNIYWKEPKDLQMFWATHERTFLILLGLCCFIFFLVIYYGSGVKIV